MTVNHFTGRAVQRVVPGGPKLPWQILSGTLRNPAPSQPSPSGAFSPRRAARLAAMRRMEFAAGAQRQGRSRDWMRDSLLAGAAQSPQATAGVLGGLIEPSISSAESSAMQNPDAWRRLYGSVGDLFNRS